MMTLERYIPNGEAHNQPFQLSFNTALMTKFQGSRVTSEVCRPAWLWMPGRESALIFPNLRDAPIHRGSVLVEEGVG